MTPKKTHWLRNSIAIMLLFAIAGLALSAVQFMNSSRPTAATANIEFTFEGAANGIAPNGSLFNISDITSDEVLTEALKARDLDGTYTAEQIRECLVARGVYPANMVEQVRSYISLLDTTSNHEVAITDYHATTYTVELYDDFDSSISRENLEGLLKAVISAYKDNFAKIYANGLKQDDLTASLSEYDYPQQADIIEAYLSTVAGYAQEMYARRPSFRHEGAGFNDIVVRLKSLIGSDLARVKADLTLNALSRESDRLKHHYEYEIKVLENQQESQRTRLDALDQLIDAYEKNSVIYLTNGQIVTRIENNSNLTYDTLIDQQTEVSKRIAAISAQALAYRQLLADLTGDEAEPDAAEGIQDGDVGAERRAEAASTADIQIAAVEKNIQAVADKGKACVDDFAAMLKAFNEQEINDKTVSVTRYRYETPTILSGAFITSAIKTAGPICVIGFMLCMVLIIRSRRREERQ